jgi:hypothetical protein
LASERLGKYYPHVTKIERIPGEHWATLEQGGTLAKMIEMLTNQPHANDDWTGHSISIHSKLAIKKALSLRKP